MGSKIFSITKKETKAASKMLLDLSEVLRKVGIDAELKENADYSFLIFRYDNDEVKKKFSRNAGLFCKNATKWRVSVKECTDRMANGETASDIAKEIGIGRATLFRRLKQAKKDGKDVIEI